MFIQYPGKQTDLFLDWTLTDEDCEYFESGKMDYYDARCRPFYREAIQNPDQSIFYGPYFNPEPFINRFYAVTLSQAVNYDDGIIGVLNHDIRLEFKDERDKLFGITSDYYHYFITSPEGKPYIHSSVEIESENATLTMVEFSPNNISLSSEPQTAEAEYFNDTIFPELVDVQTTELYEFRRLGHLSLIGISPMNIRFYTQKVNGTNLSKTFVLALVTDEEQFIAKVTDKSGIIFDMII